VHRVLGVTGMWSTLMLGVLADMAGVRCPMRRHRVVMGVLRRGCLMASGACFRLLSMVGVMLPVHDSSFGLPFDLDCRGIVTRPELYP
jgi:hypothetical protein